MSFMVKGAGKWVLRKEKREEPVLYSYGASYVRATYKNKHLCKQKDEKIFVGKREIVFFL